MRNKKEEETFQTQMLRLVVRKCRKDSIIVTLRKWGRLSEETLNFLKGKSKEEITRTVIDMATAKEKAQDIMTNEILGDLDLSCAAMNLSHDPRTLRSRLLNSIQLKWKYGQVFGNMSYFGGGLWYRLHLSTSLSGKKAGLNVYHPANSIFMVTFAGSPFILLSQTRVNIFKTISEALIQVFEAERLTDIKLSGKHVSSLAAIALDKNAEVNIHNYRKLEQIDNPLMAGQKRKLHGEEFEDRDDMVDDNRMEKRMRCTEVEKKFGPDPQPILETLDYNFDLPIRGNKGNKMDPPAESEHYTFKVQLKGPSVLEGLSTVARKGFLKFPLPQHLHSAVSNKRNHFSIVSKKARLQSQPK